MYKSFICGVVLVIFATCQANGFETIFSTNFGEKANVHTDKVNGITFENEQAGCTNYFRFDINYRNVDQSDRRLYQDTCYDKYMKFNLTLTGNGRYLLVLKTVPQEDDFIYNMDVVLRSGNKSISVLSDLNVRQETRDVDRVYDILVPFYLCKKTLVYQGKHKLKLSQNVVVLELRSHYTYSFPLAAMALLKGDFRYFDTRLTKPSFAKSEMVRYKCPMPNESRN
jgi:hypothetical protein